VCRHYIVYRGTVMKPEHRLKKKFKRRIGLFRRVRRIGVYKRVD